MAYPGAIPGQPPVQDPLWGYFSYVAGQDGQIDADELQRCLTSSGIAGSYQPFNRETCVLMINMLDRDRSGQMGFSEFKELWGALNQWKTCFMGIDRDRSGSVDARELQQALTSFGYNLSPQALDVIMKRYSSAGKIAFDSFVGLCVRLRLITSQFQARDTMRNGTATFRYDDFVQVVMSS